MIAPAGSESNRYAPKKAICNRPASKYDSSKTARSRGISASTRTVRNPHMKNSAVTTTNGAKGRPAVGLGRDAVGHIDGRHRRHSLNGVAPRPARTVHPLHRVSSSSSSTACVGDLRPPRAHAEVEVVGVVGPPPLGVAVEVDFDVVVEVGAVVGVRH